MHHEKSNHTWFGGFRFRLDAGVLCQRSFGDEHHNGPDYGFNAGDYGFNAGALARRPRAPWREYRDGNGGAGLLIGRSQRRHSATRSRFMSAHYAVVFVECGGAPPPFSIG
jgi:hypothetical protein